MRGGLGNVDDVLGYGEVWGNVGLCMGIRGGLGSVG